MTDARLGVVAAVEPAGFVDNEQLETGAGTVLRQRVRLGGADGDALVPVLNLEPNDGAYGAVVRHAGVLHTVQRDAEAFGALAVAGDAVELRADGRSSFSVYVTGAWSGSLVLERTLLSQATAVALGLQRESSWTSVGAFLAGTQRTTSAKPITQSRTKFGNGSWHGNMSASKAVRVRAGSDFAGTAQVVLLGGAGTGTVTIGAIAENANVIGATTDLLAHFTDPARGGAWAFNSATDVVQVQGTGASVAAFYNPPSSVKDLWLAKVKLSCRAAGTFRRYRGGSITPSGNARPSVNRAGGRYQLENVASANVWAAATFTASGGLLGFAEEHVPGSDTDVLGGSLRLPPGDLIYWTFTPHQNQATFASVEMVWWELPKLD